MPLDFLSDDMSESIRKMVPPVGFFVKAKSVGGLLETIFIVREESTYLATTPEKYRFQVGFKIGVLSNGDVYTVIALIRIEGYGLYEFYFNYYDPDGEPRECLELLGKQTTNSILFFGDTGKREKGIRFLNTSQKWIKLILQGLQNQKPWSMREFDLAKYNIQSKYSLASLWQAMEQK